MIPGAINIIELVSVLVAILLVAAMVLALCKRIKMPFTVALVLVGLAITHVSGLMPSHLQPYFHYSISPDMILYVCLPTLLFESAFALDPRQMRRNMAPILTLAIPGLLISTGLIGLMVYSLTSISLAPALLLGAILSATDPIAVIALFKSLGAPKRLTVLVEGESLFNDATSIVTAKLLFTVVIAGVFTSHDLSHGVYDFFMEFFGGILVGWLIAVVTGTILGYVESDPEIEISLTTILAYGSFILAQNVFHVSGVMATVAAGLTLSGWGRAKISPSVHHYLEHFWEFLAYIANALIFLLVGLSVNLSALADSLGMLAVVILAMLVSRAVITFGLIPITCKLPGAVPINGKYQTAIFWGGLRGAIALAIVLSLDDFQYKELFTALVTGAVLFTLLVKGLTMETLVRWLGLDQPPLSDRLAREEGQLNATKAALRDIPSLQRGGLFSARIASQLEKRCQKRIKNIEHHILSLRKEELDESAEEKLLFLRSLAAEKNQYYQMFTKGHLTEHTYRNLNDIVVTQIDRLRHSPSNRIDRAIGPLPRSVMHSLLHHIPFISSLMQRLDAKKIVYDYELFWGQYHGYETVLNNLKAIVKDQPEKRPMVETVRQHFQRWHDYTRKELDSIAEQFPEFVSSMQHRLANRLILQAELDALEAQVKSGMLPADVAKTMTQKLESKMYKLREKGILRLDLDPNELLRKVPFFQDIPSSAFAQILALLKSKIYSAGEAIITEGERGPSMYLIMRGVVRVSKRIDGVDKDLATLMAGDFFGESALLHDAPRNATCSAVTPCNVYELSRADFLTVQKDYPSIAEAIRKADEERLSQQ